MMRLARGFQPLRAVDRREEGVAFHVGIDLGHDQPVGARHRLGIQLRAADQEDLVDAHAQALRVFQRRCHLGAFDAQVRVAADHDIAPARQRAPDRVPGLAAHDHGRAHGGALEMRQVFRQAPRQRVVAADGAVAGLGDNQGQDRHTATGALMAACDW
ncbi:hypothetical protein D3C81_1074280 [compost metagenome]